ncbi:stomatin-like protein 3 [Chamaea fasciata]|uniref:stomatin-like protein 3 n=1 Tax=Chamaea fasciata TaxID=190680 RepID=UPI00336A5B11
MQLLVQRNVGEWCAYRVTNSLKTLVQGISASLPSSAFCTSPAVSRYTAVSSVRGSELTSKGMDPQRERSKEKNTEHLIADRQEGIGVCGWILVSLSFLLVLITFPISIWACIKVVREFEHAVVFHLACIVSKKAKGPGMILVLPCTDTFINVDLRMVTCKIPPQEIFSRDAVTAQVDGVVSYRIHSTVSAVVNVTDVHSVTLLLAQTTLRNLLGTQSSAQLLAGREEIAHSTQATLDSATEQWGVKVAHMELRDIQIPVAMQRAMAAEAEAARETKAKVVAAEGEMNASKALQKAPMVLAESPAGLPLHYVQTLTAVAAQNNSTIVFPLPVDMFGSLGQKSTGG